MFIDKIITITWMGFSKVQLVVLYVAVYLNIYIVSDLFNHYCNYFLYT